LVPIAIGITNKIIAHIAEYKSKKNPQNDILFVGSNGYRNHQHNLLFVGVITNKIIAHIAEYKSKKNPQMIYSLLVLSPT
jgi:hypothetical protein